MGIGLFLLLPESKEVWEDWAKANIKDEHLQELPYAFFVTFFAYSFMLFVEKVLFSTPSLIPLVSGEGHPHGHDHGDHSGHNHDEPIETEHKELKSIDHGKDGEEDSDEDEEAFKNVVSAKGKFASFLGMRNCKKNLIYFFSKNVSSRKQTFSTYGSCITKSQSNLN